MVRDGLDFGEVYVLDWGIAKAIDAPEGEPIAPAPQAPIPAAATQAGAMMGTVGYMSPEQLRGEDVGPRTDGMNHTKTGYSSSSRTSVAASARSTGSTRSDQAAFGRLAPWSIAMTTESAPS